MTRRIISELRGFSELPAWERMELAASLLLWCGVSGVVALEFSEHEAFEGSNGTSDGRYYPKDRCIAIARSVWAQSEMDEFICALIHEGARAVDHARWPHSPLDHGKEFRKAAYKLFTRFCRLPWNRRMRRLARSARLRKQFLRTSGILTTERR